MQKIQALLRKFFFTQIVQIIFLLGFDPTPSMIIIFLLPLTTGNCLELTEGNFKGLQQVKILKFVYFCVVEFNNNGGS